MTEREVFVLADRTLNDVVATIVDDGVGLPENAPLLERLLGPTGRDPNAA
jgi:hypothetical protein